MLSSARNPTQLLTLWLARHSTSPRTASRRPGGIPPELFSSTVRQLRFLQRPDGTEYVSPCHSSLTLTTWHAGESQPRRHSQHKGTFVRTPALGATTCGSALPRLCKPACRPRSPAQSPMSSMLVSFSRGEQPFIVTHSRLLAKDSWALLRKPAPQCREDFGVY